MSNQKPQTVTVCPPRRLPATRENDDRGARGMKKVKKQRQADQSIKQSTPLSDAHMFGSEVLPRV
jgi:hypothetical protein